jgi:hypothetical protein
LLRIVLNTDVMSLQKSKNAYKNQSELEIQVAKNSALEGKVSQLCSFFTSYTAHSAAQTSGYDKN